MYLYLLVGVGLVVGGIYYYFTQPVKYEAQNEPVVVTEEVTVDYTDKRIQEALEAADATIKAKAQAEYDAVYKAEQAKVQAAVLLEVEKEIEAKRLEVESQITAY